MYWGMAAGLLAILFLAYPIIQYENGTGLTLKGAISAVAGKFFAAVFVTMDRWGGRVRRKALNLSAA